MCWMFLSRNPAAIRILESCIRHDSNLVQKDSLFKNPAIFSCNKKEIYEQLILI